MKFFAQKFNFLMFLILVCMPIRSISQNAFEKGCGTTITEQSLGFYNSIRPTLKKYENQFKTLKTSDIHSATANKNLIPIKTHIVRGTNGTGGLTVLELDDALEQINAIFANAFMEFYVLDDPDYIDNDQFYHFHSREELDLVTSRNVLGAINIYFTEEIESETDETICGYTHTDKQTNIIMMGNSCATNGSSLAHELGHVFSLIHTHGLDNGQATKELVNGSNCSSEGDQICDTPADPKLTRQNLNNFCHYIGMETDVNGDVYSPDTANIMSYSMKGCRKHFSQQQMARMYAYYQSMKSNFSADMHSETPAIASTSIDLSGIKVYPNPVADNLIYIKANTTDTSLAYEISNVMGQIFKVGAIGNEPINIEPLPSGTYLLAIKNHHSRTIKKIVK